ncbi:N-acetylmuramoyl-L-alanine amidase-like domain-containing protein [Pleurocapsa sp. PCC 7319]|uniref:N-acetylmuramoyl-L-alanine amidase-like domain-containing protein n=1 Tax=Pleurocapsa sp. PCC 7319 TaxID=118161 RepID=UPI000346519B|nr:N-acetylmuramoyl-L-alanine amidase-like domain-containing protein [Pleurocapsa sp. PCC 7319]
MHRVTNSWVFKLGLGFIIFIISNYSQTTANVEPNYLLAEESQILPKFFEFPNAEDRKIYQTITNYAIANQLDLSPIGNIVQTVAQQFLGAEYKAGLLDQSSQETLFISLKQFDCLLFVETVMAIAKNIAQQNYSYQALTRDVENQRYWNGKMNGYCSRLHYFSDWIADNQRRGNVQNITPQLGGVNTVKKLDFMTTHRHRYPNLVKSQVNFECIASIESSLPETLNYIPTKDIRQIYPQLQPGDIIGVATNIAGLDFTHTGFIHRQSAKNLGFIHASPRGRVVISPDLQNYVRNVNQAIGIVVIRTNKPHYLDRDLIDEGRQ